MYAILFIAIMTWMTALVNDQVRNNISLMKNYMNQAKRYDLQVVSEHMMQYQLENGVALSDLNTLAAQPGFEAARSSVSSHLGVAYVSTLTDTLWTYARVSVFTLQREKEETATTYAAQNGCGTGTFFVANSWCGSPTSQWFRHETREKNNVDIVEQRHRQQRLMQKFSSYFNANDSFPNKDAGNNPLVAGTSYVLTNLVGYVGTAKTCSATFVWQGVPINCEDLFDKWGGNIVFTYMSDTHIALLSTSKIFRNTGSAISIATDLNAT